MTLAHWAGRIVAEIDWVRFDPSHAWLPAQ